MRFGLVATCLLALALAACGSGGDSGSGLSIENKLGTARIDGRPERVVALDCPSADAAIALGVVPVAMAEVDYDKLAGIAPVVAYAQGEGLDPWQRSAVRIGRALGREERAREPVDQVRRDVARARRAKPAFAGSTLSFYNFYEGDPWVINTASELSIRFLSELGFRLPPAGPRSARSGSTCSRPT